MLTRAKSRAKLLLKKRYSKKECLVMSHPVHRKQNGQIFMAKK